MNDVLRDLELWFPTSVEYKAFDSQGRRLELYAHPHLVGPIWSDNAHHSSLFVRAIEREPSGVEELTGMLRAWLPMVGVPVGPADDWSLGQLLATAAEHVGFS